jgi:hypothetical protein
MVTISTLFVILFTLNWGNFAISGVTLSPITSTDTHFPIFDSKVIFENVHAIDQQSHPVMAKSTNFTVLTTCVNSCVSSQVLIISPLISTARLQALKSLLWFLVFSEKLTI